MWSRNSFFLRWELLGYEVERKGMVSSVGMRRWGLSQRWARLVLDEGETDLCWSAGQKDRMGADVGYLAYLAMAK